MEIADATIDLAKSYCDAVDAVACEGKWLSVSKGFSLSDSLAFMRYCARSNAVQLFLKDGHTVAGWCDIVPYGFNGGRLGIGLRKEYRNQGYGGRLLDAALDKAAGRYKKIVLFVRTTNTGATALYEKRGFKVKKVFKEYAYEGLPERVLMMVKKMKKKD